MAISPDIMAGRRPHIPEYVIPKVAFQLDPEPHLQANELAGQRWFVTGAGRRNGIGAAIVDLAAAPRRSNNITRATLQVLGGEDYERYIIVPQSHPEESQAT